ncbi:MAG: PriCT-2 domain-containing protein, partial [Candidatus Cryptobacteroides sp.]
MKQTFNPQEWLNGQTQETISSKTTDNVKQSTVAEDIELITQRIEQSRTDITAGYDNWRDLAFALSEELGESGRSYFHRISRLNPDYNSEESDKQYDSCLKAHGSGITIKTF